MSAHTAEVRTNAATDREMIYKTPQCSDVSFWTAGSLPFWRRPDPERTTGGHVMEKEREREREREREGV